MSAAPDTPVAAFGRSSMNRGGLKSSARAARGVHLFAAALSAIPLVILVAPAEVSAASNKVRITALSDVAFGTIANLNADAVAIQSVCLYADTNTNGYNVTASGTGPGGSFALSSGATSLPYDVQWSGSPGQSSGTRLTANVPLTGQVSTATQQTCSSGPAASASLIVVLPTTGLSSATAGSYSGNLTLLIGPE